MKVKFLPFRVKGSSRDIHLSPTMDNASSWDSKSRKRIITFFPDLGCRRMKNGINSPADQDVPIPVFITIGGVNLEMCYYMPFISMGFKNFSQVIKFIPVHRSGLTLSIRFQALVLLLLALSPLPLLLPRPLPLRRVWLYLISEQLPELLLH